MLLSKSNILEHFCLSIWTEIFNFKGLQTYLTAFHVVITKVKPEEDLEGYLNFFLNRDSEIHRSDKICQGYSWEWWQGYDGRSGFFLSCPHSVTLLSFFRQPCPQ